MLERPIITGGQSGVDQAGRRAAKAFGIPTGQAMPRGFLTEDGPPPEFAELYGATKLATDSYSPGPEANVRAAGGLLWFGDPTNPGGRLTLKWAGLAGKTRPGSTTASRGLPGAGG